MITNTPALQTLRSRAGLNNRNTDAGTVDRVGNVAKSGPGIQKVHRRPPIGVGKEAYLYDMERLA